MFSFLLLLFQVKSEKIQFSTSDLTKNLNALMYMIFYVPNISFIPNRCGTSHSHLNSNNISLKCNQLSISLDLVHIRISLLLPRQIEPWLQYHLLESGGAQKQQSTKLPKILKRPWHHIQKLKILGICTIYLIFLAAQINTWNSILSHKIPVVKTKLMMWSRIFAL